MVKKIDIKKPEPLHAKINQIIDWCSVIEQKLDASNVRGGVITEAYLLDKLDGYIYKRDGYKQDSIQYEFYDLLVKEFSQLMKMYQAACASGADTVAEARVCDYCKGSGYDPYPNHDTTQRPCPQCEAPSGEQP